MIKRYTTDKMKNIWGEKSKFASWLKVEIAVARAQSEYKVIPVSAYEKIRKGRFSVKEIEIIEKTTRHDLIAFLKSVGKSIGDASRYLHFGLTSYDIEDTALALRTREACNVLVSALRNLHEALKKLAKKHKNTVMMGRTHSVHAEPITFGLKCLSWLKELERNMERLERAKANVGFGKISGAVGTYSQLSPEIEEMALKELGLKPEPVATQVVPRDRYAEVVLVLSLLACGFERIATEVRNLQHTEISEIAEPFYKGQRGSSAMPHKRNPIVSERICGLARVVRGNVQAALENINLWHERDISNSSVERIILPDSFTLLHYMTNILIRIVSALEVNPGQMQKNIELSKGQFYSQRLMLVLVKKGVEKDRAYEMVQRLSFRAQEKGRDFETVVSEDKEIQSLLKSYELSEIFALKKLLKHIDYIYKRTLPL